MYNQILKNCASCTKIKDIHKGCKKLDVLVGSIYEGVRTENCTTSLLENCSNYTKIKNLCQRAFIFAFLVDYQVRGLLGEREFPYGHKLKNFLKAL